MKKGHGTSSSSDSSEKQRSQSDDEDSTDNPRHGCSTEDSSSDSVVVSESRMKRSRAFSSSFSFEEDPLHFPSPKNSSGVAIPELVESELAAECTHLKKQETIYGTSQPSSGLFRPQELWLAVTRCLSIRWPPCLTFNRLDRNNRKLAYQMDCDQSEDTLSSVSTDSANESSSSTTTSPEDSNVTLVKHEEEEAKSRVVKRGPPSRWGMSRSYPRLPRDRQASDLVLASMILEKEMFLRIELMDRGEENHELRYQAEWKLSENTRELAAGVWLSRTLID